MNWKSIDETPALSKPAIRASTWTAELVLLAAVLAAATKLSGSPVPPPPVEQAPVVVAVPLPPPVEIPLPPPAPAPIPPPLPVAVPAPVPVPDAAPARIKPPEAFIPPYRREWRTAAARAAQRDLDGAIAIIRRAGRESEESRREAAADLADIDRLRSLEDRAAGRLAALTRGTSLELELRDRRLVSGRVIQADRERVELKTAEGAAFVEFVDLSWSTLARGDTQDARAVALAFLLDGRRVDGGDEKHQDLPRPDAPSPLDRTEIEARPILYEAERGFRMPASRAAAVAKYRLLLSDFAATALVRRSLPRLSARAKAPTEIYFAAADLRGSGTFRLQPDAWRTEGAIDFTKARFSFVEAEFEAEAGVAHRLFVRLGGCCEERLLAYAQASGLEKAHPTRGTKVALEPGSIYAFILRRPVAGLPKTHEAGHPVLWGWAEVPLPVYATSGVKRARILADREGVAVSGLLVSTTRAVLPTDVDLPALEATRDVE